MADPDAPLTPAVPTHVTCPSCGVAVQVGYPRCPRCHAKVAQPASPARTKRPTFREELLAGGTSVADDEGGRLWWVVGGLGGIVVVLAVWLLARGDERPAGAGALDAGTEDVTDDEPDEADDDPAPEAPSPPTGAAPADDDGLADALRALDDALRTARLWSKVTRADDVVVIESSLCDDDEMAPAIDELAADLAAAGAAAVRCVAPHGAVAWERRL